MVRLSTNGLPYIEEEAATGEVADIYGQIKRDLQMPFIPNVVKGMSASPEMLAFFMKTWMASEEHRTLPDSLVSMINYTIATKSNCTYCSANHELTCRTLGVDEQTLDKLIKDLDHLHPRRVQVIIDFALKVAKNAQGLVRADFELLRDQGVTDGEIVEIIMIAALAVFSDIIADSLMVEVDRMVTDSLTQMKS